MLEITGKREYPLTFYNRTRLTAFVERVLFCQERTERGTALPGTTVVPSFCYTLWVGTAADNYPKERAMSPERSTSRPSRLEECRYRWREVGVIILFVILIAVTVLVPVPAFR